MSVYFFSKVNYRDTQYRYNFSIYGRIPHVEYNFINSTFTWCCLFVIILCFFLNMHVSQLYPLVLSLRTLYIGRLGNLRSDKGDANEIVAENRVRVISDLSQLYFKSYSKEPKCDRFWFIHILSYRFNRIRSQLETVLDFWLVNVCLKECHLIKGGHTFRLLAARPT